MLICVLILTIVSGIYAVGELYSTRSFLERELTALGGALGDSCKKLLMIQHISTTEDILASLRGHSSIRAAFLFNQDGEPVTQYLDSSAMPFILAAIAHDFPDSANKFWLNLKQREVITSLQHFSVFLPITYNDQQIGSLYLLSDLKTFYVHLNRVAFAVLVLLGMLLLFSWWLAGRLQRPVSKPLLSLVDTMALISRERNFTVRAKKESQDEIGQLVDGFNNMLEQIDNHRQELVEHQHSLEATVEERTEELRKLVSVLEYAKQQAEAASEAKSQFLANITHELRTPLIGVLGMNELMFRTSLDEQQQMLAKTVQSSGENLLELINNVLDYSKIEAGKMQLEKAEFSLYQVVDDVLNLLAGTAAEKGLSLYSRIPLQATCKVLGDKVRIRQILMNLIGNAIKFTEQGAVTVNVACMTKPTSVTEFAIEIIDTGIGMDVKAQEQIFTVFYQADASHTRKYGGTGLGLTIVQQLVKLLDGSVELESQIGKGSCFRIGFSLPLLKEGGLALPESLRQQPVLVYVGDDSSQEILVSRLTELGTIVTSADSVADAWYRLGSAERSGKPFAMMLLSPTAELPDGQPLYQAIREEDRLNTLRRVLVSNRSQQIELRRQEHKLYLPFGWDQLVETLSLSWHELHLVEKSPVAQTASSDSEEPAAKLLLADGSIASRELIKISLRELPVEIEVVTNLSLLNEVSPEDYCAMLIDVSSFPIEQLVDVGQQRLQNVPLFVLVGPEDDLSELSELATGILHKPFKSDLFVPLLQPLLDAEVEIAEDGVER